MPRPDLLDAKRGTRLTGIPANTLRRWAREGRLTHYKILGTAVRFDRADLLDFARRQVTEGTTRLQLAENP